MKRKNLVEFRCNKCGAHQPKNAEKSNENWNVFDCNQKCKCGGEFVMWIGGELLKGAADDKEVTS